MMKGESRGRLALFFLGLALLASCAEPTTYQPQAPTVPKLRLPRNDAYQGSVITGALRPTFTWEPSTAANDGSIPIRYELQYGADPKLELDTVTVPVDQPTHQPDANLAVSMTPPVGRRYYWRVRACLLASCSAYSPTWWVNLGRSAKDFNGDGYADVAVGAPQYDSRGAVSVFFGGLTMDTVTDGFLDDSINADHFGKVIANAGDINGDGFTDVAVASRSAVRVYFGGHGSFEETPDMTIPGTSSDVSSGDVNADGFSDLIIGDAENGDTRAGAGKVSVYYGGTDTVLDGALNGESMYQGFGSHIDSSDINGDGFADLVISSSHFDDDFVPACFADVFYGQAGDSFQSLERVHLRANTTDYCTSRTVLVGDLDGDGFDDLATGIKKSGLVPQQIEFFRGGEPLTEIPDAKMDGSKEGFTYLYAIVPAGDLNGDGRADIAVWDGYNPQKNSVYMGRDLERGGGVSSPSAGAITPGPTASAGDVNGDGYGDLILGSPTTNNARICSGGPGSVFDERSCYATLTGSGRFGEVVR